MNTLSFFGLIALIIGRLIIFIIATEYWWNKKSRSHWLWVVGIGSWVIAGILPIIRDIVIDQMISDLLITLNSGFSALSLVLVMSGFLCYYNLINLKYIWLYSIFFLFNTNHNHFRKFK